MTEPSSLFIDNELIASGVLSPATLSPDAVRYIAHDLNNALTTVIGYAQLLDEDGELPPRLHRQLQAIVQDAERAQTLAAHLLLLSQPEESGAQSSFDQSTLIGNSTLEAPLDVAHIAAPRTLHVLVVDDEEPVITLISEILSLDGHCVTPAFNGAEALALLGVEEFDLIISDVRMPAVGGPPFAEILRTQRTDLLPRVIFVTGDTVSASTNNFLHGSACPVLVKPFSPARLRALVAQYAA